MLPCEPHLFEITLVSCQTLHLVADRREPNTTRGRPKANQPALGAVGHSLRAAEDARLREELRKPGVIARRALEKLEEPLPLPLIEREGAFDAQVPAFLRCRHGSQRTSAVVGPATRKDANDDDRPGIEVELQPHAPVADS